MNLGTDPDSLRRAATAADNLMFAAQRAGVDSRWFQWVPDHLRTVANRLEFAESAPSSTHPPDLVPSKATPSDGSAT